MESAKLDLLAARVAQAVELISRLQRDLSEKEKRVAELEVELEMTQHAQSEGADRLAAENQSLQSELHERDERLNQITERLEQVLGAIDSLGESEGEGEESAAEEPEALFDDESTAGDEDQRDSQTMEFDIDSIERSDHRPDGAPDEGFRFE